MLIDIYCGGRGLKFAFAGAVTFATHLLRHSKRLLWWIFIWFVSATYSYVLLTPILESGNLLLQYTRLIVILLSVFSDLIIQFAGQLVKFSDGFEWQLDWQWKWVVHFFLYPQLVPWRHGNNCELSKLRYNYIHRCGLPPAGHYKVIENAGVRENRDTGNSWKLLKGERAWRFGRNWADGLPESGVSMTNGNRFNPLRSSISAYPSAKLVLVEVA